VGVTLILPVRASSHLCLRKQISPKTHQHPDWTRAPGEQQARAGLLREALPSRLPWPRCSPALGGAEPWEAGGGRTRGCSPLLCSFPPAVVARTQSLVGQGILRPFLSLCLEWSGELLGRPPAEAKSPGPRVARPAVGPPQRREFVFTVFYHPQGKQAP